MAGTLTVGMTGAMVGEVQRDDLNVNDYDIPLTNGIGGTPGLVAFTTTEADISLAPLTGKAYVKIRHVGTANKIRIGPKSGGVMVPLTDLAAGEHAWFPVESGVTLRGRSDTGTVNGTVEAYN